MESMDNRSPKRNVMMLEKMISGPVSAEPEEENKQVQEPVAASKPAPNPKPEVTPAPARSAVPVEDDAVTGRGRPKEVREIKKSFTLSLLPSLYEDIKKIAYVKRSSISEIITAMMEEYRENHKADLTEYNRLMK